MSYELIADSKKILPEFYGDSFDINKKIILEEDPGIVKTVAKGSIKHGSVKITKYTPNLISLDVETSSTVLLFLSDSYYPAWKALINGKDTHIYRADYTFRAVVVPKGKSKVDFVYTEYF